MKQKNVKIIGFSYAFQASYDIINISKYEVKNNMKKLIITCSDERLITPSGLTLVGQMLGKNEYEATFLKI